MYMYTHSLKPELQCPGHFTMTQQFTGHVQAKLIQYSAHMANFNDFCVDNVRACTCIVFMWLIG